MPCHSHSEDRNSNSVLLRRLRCGQKNLEVLKGGCVQPHLTWRRTQRNFWIKTQEWQ